MKFKPKTYLSIKNAVELWCSNRPKAEETYGDISEWDTSEVMYMHELFKDCNEFNDNIGDWDV